AELVEALDLAAVLVEVRLALARRRVRLGNGCAGHRLSSRSLTGGPAVRRCRPVVARLCGPRRCRRGLTYAPSRAVRGRRGYSKGHTRRHAGRRPARGPVPVRWPASRHRGGAGAARRALEGALVRQTPCRVLRGTRLAVGS